MQYRILFLSFAIFLTGCSHVSAPAEALPVAGGDALVEEKDHSEIESLADSAANPEPQDLPEPVAQQPVKLPATHDTKVAFVSQSPYASWDELHQEACEEASMAMAVRHFRGQSLTVEEMEAEIQDGIAWQTANGYSVDLTAAEVVEVLRDYYGYGARLTTDISVENFKRELAAGNLIIVPAAGRSLGNPYFTPPGPVYHMLVVRGYDRNEFITNDPGTRRGERYKYRYRTLLDAVHDWNGGAVSTGQKVAVVVEPAA